ncbi:MAG TPA: aldo/keto reductase [Roseiflexaceae bacterium]|nr:aldo/keto reductase [Roseiflexaceae bacterium]HMP42020.1 aldo/keto reductase [Roseiflexaceae bacterium]
MTIGSQLPLRRFGTTGLEVTNLCIGCAPLGDMVDTFAYSVSEEQALATLRAAFGGPIRFIDTAASYGDGESERRIGIGLAEHGGLPADYVLASKADRDLHTGEFSGAQIRRSVERSLRLLGLDSIQIMFLHDPEHTTFDACMAPGGPVEVLLQMKDEGLIGHVGVAGGPIDLMIRYVETGAFEAVITHNRYTLLNRSADPLLTMAAERGLAVLNAAPYGSGILAKGPDAYPRYAYQEAPDLIIERARAMAEICSNYGVPLAAAALQFSLRDPRITSTIIGMTRPERIAQTVELANHAIPDAIWAELDEVGFQSDDPEAERFK